MKPVSGERPAVSASLRVKTREKPVLKRVQWVRRRVDKPEGDAGKKASDHLYELREAGVSIWLDTLSRELLDSGDFERLVERA
jgi:hypothetical protein